MNISYNWLKELVEFDLSPDELGRRLTNVGLAVEGIHPHENDFVLDIDLTSNRPDCLSHLGVAREIGVIVGNDIIPGMGGNANPSQVPVPSILAGDIVRIDDPELCHRFTARIFKDVKIGPSPGWLVERLEAIGERSINNVADITNFVMHELGQPMHAFDRDKLSEGRIVVRRAEADEIITTLDEAERKLDHSVLCICDAEKPAAVAGIMGGSESSITEQTANVLLEVAYFKRESIRASSRKLGLATEASYRFERGVDIDRILLASKRAADLISELAGGVEVNFVDVYPTRSAPQEIASEDISNAVRRLTGLDVEETGCVRILNALGIHNTEPTIYLAPSWRYDLSIEEDLVEEVARHSGYENIGTDLPPAYGAGEYQHSEPGKKRVREMLADMGFDEAITYSFIDTAFDDLIDTAPGLIDNAIDEAFVTLHDSVIEGAVRMRPTILPGLLEAVRLNFNHKRKDIKLFEIGKVFASTTGEDPLPNERELLSIVLTGGEMNEERAFSSRELDFYDIKGAIEASLDSIGIANARFAPANVKHLRPGQSAAVSVGEQTIGHLGRLSDQAAAKYKFKQPIFVAEIDIETAFDLRSDRANFKPLARFPGIIRDVSFVAKRNINFDQIRDAVISQRFEICRSVEFVDVFEGKVIAEDERSITIRLEYRSDEGTLIEEDVEAVHQQILMGIETQLKIKPRI